MNIISVDPALSTTGYSIITDNEDVVLVNKFTTSSNMIEDDRIYLICEKLLKVAKDFNAEVIIFEDGFVGNNMKTGLQLSTLRGAILGVFMFNDIEAYHMLPTEIRKEFGLKGNVKKEDVAKQISIEFPGVAKTIGPYSDKQNKDKTSDMYDAVSIGIAFVRKLKRQHD